MGRGWLCPHGCPHHGKGGAAHPVTPLPPPFCPHRSLEPSCSLRPASPGATDTLALVTQLGAICKVTPPLRYLCPANWARGADASSAHASLSLWALGSHITFLPQFLALCVVTQPCHYPDGARLSLVTLLSFLGLDRALRCQPLPEVQVLLHYLLQGIHDWHQQVWGDKGCPLIRCPPCHPSPRSLPQCPTLSPAACALPGPVPAFSPPPQPGCAHAAAAGSHGQGQVWQSQQRCPLPPACHQALCQGWAGCDTSAS